MSPRLILGLLALIMTNIEPSKARHVSLSLSSIPHQKGLKRMTNPPQDKFLISSMLEQDNELSEERSEVNAGEGLSPALFKKGQVSLDKKVKLPAYLQELDSQKTDGLNDGPIIARAWLPVDIISDDDDNEIGEMDPRNPWTKVVFQQLQDRSTLGNFTKAEVILTLIKKSEAVGFIITNTRDRDGTMSPVVQIRLDGETQQPLGLSDEETFYIFNITEFIQNKLQDHLEHPNKIELFFKISSHSNIKFEDLFDTQVDRPLVTFQYGQPSTIPSYHTRRKRSTSKSTNDNVSEDSRTHLISNKVPYSASANNEYVNVPSISHGNPNNDDTVTGDDGSLTRKNINRSLNPNSTRTTNNNGQTNILLSTNPSNSTHDHVSNNNEISNNGNRTGDDVLPRKKNVSNKLNNDDKKSNGSPDGDLISAHGPGAHTNYCKKISWEVTVEDIEWDDVISPRRLDLGYCTGICPSPMMNEYFNFTLHSFFLDRFRRMKLFDAPRNFPQSCCVPVSYKPTVVWLEDQENNYVQYKFENVLVDSCGCR